MRLISAYLKKKKKKSKMKGGQRPNALQKVDLPIIENKVCQEWYKDEKKPLTIVDTSMCAGFEQGGKDACQVGNRYSIYVLMFVFCSKSKIQKF